MSKYAGADWVESCTFGKGISPMGRAAADLLGDVFQGIYHIKNSALAKVEWSNPNFIIITVGVMMSTVDDDLLTRFVVLAHERAMRVSFGGIGNGYMRITISQRTREGDLYHGCPTIEEHIATLRERYKVLA